MSEVERREALYLLLVEADALVFALAMTPAVSGQMNVSALRPHVEALAEAVACAKPFIEPDAAAAGERASDG